MPRPLTRNEKISIAFLIVWMIFWAGGMMIMVVALGGAAMAGDLAPLVFMAVWLVAAGFGLASAGRKLRQLLMRDGPLRRPSADQPWHDGMTERPELPPREAPKPGPGPGPGRFDRL